MKILILHKTLVIGGVEKVLIDYLNIFSKLGYDIDLNLSYDLNEKNQYIENIPKSIRVSFSLTNIDYLNIENLRKNKKKSFWHKMHYELNKMLHRRKYISNIVSILSKNSYDMIIDFSYCSDALVKYNIFRKYSSAKIIRWNHSQISSKDSKKMARVYSYYDRIIAISYEMAGRLISDLNLQTEKIISIYNPINLEDIKAKSEQSIPEDLEKDYLLTVTRLVDGKGLFELIEIYKQLKENGIRNKLYIIGNGELKNELQKKIEEFSLEKDCILLGARTNPYPYFKRAKLFLFTSESEGLGLVLLESIALGTPVISMNCPTGPTEIIGKNNEYGKLIQLHDKDGFCSAVYELLHNPTLYQSYIEKSLERGADFSKENIEINIKHLFHQLYNNGLPKP